MAEVSCLAMQALSLVSSTFCSVPWSWVSLSSWASARSRLCWGLLGCAGPEAAGSEPMSEAWAWM